MKTFLLVHGAWHGGWCWRRVADRLTSGGHRVFAPSLTGLGDRAHLFSADISLGTHVEDVVQFADAEELDQFVLVGHSYAGFVITGAADRLRSRIAHCVYLDAGVPADMSAGAVACWSDGNSPAERERRLADARNHDGAIPAPPPFAFGVTDPADADWLRRRLGPMPLQSYLGRITFANGGSDGLRRTYVAATGPRYRPLASAHERIRAAAGWNFVTLDTAHDMMVTAPDEVAALLAEA